MSQNKYWQSFGEVNDPEDFQKKQQDEFKEELPFEGFDDKGLVDAKAPRRDFLKYLGFSTAAATLAASCKIPVRKAVPYANKPDNLVPGVAKYFATTYVQDGDVTPVLAKVRDGRPIKIEGNTDCSYTGGGTSARVQASVLDLYDMYRIKYPMHRNAAGSFDEVPSFDKVDQMVTDAMKGVTGKMVILTSTIVSPSTIKLIKEWEAANSNVQHIQYDAVSYSGMLLANDASGFGKKIPSYKFGAAKVIVSLGADFLGTWLSPIEFSRDYATGRKINEKNPSMSKHYQFESFLSMTGSNADERFTHRPSDLGAVALDLLSMVTTGGEGAGSINDAKLEAGIKKVANELRAHNGEALVVCGSNDKNIQVIVNAINNAIGAYGKTIDWNSPVNYRQGIDADMAQLLVDMEAGSVGALFIQGANPVYNYANGKKFADALKKVKVTVSFGTKLDETTKLCEYVIPDHHYLESWGDAEAKAGYVSFLQPTIYPLFKTRNYQTSLLKWSGNTKDYETYFREYWIGDLGSLDEFNKKLQLGVKETPAAEAGAGSYSAAAVAEATSILSAGKKGTGDELVVYQKVSIGTGAQAGNPWLQELPDPISKATWDNYALISVTKAKELGIELNSDYEYYPEKPVLEITSGGTTMSLPCLVIPGMNANTIAIALGYGRNEETGKAAAGVGQNAYQFTSHNPEGIVYHASGVSVKNTGKKYKIAQTQIHNSYEGRIEVLRETTLATFKKEPNVIPEWREELKEEYYNNANGDFKEATLYPQHDQPGLKWGMNIDLNSCTGCGACVVACHAENNVPVVGKREVLRYHDMHWLRIDRYFVSDAEDKDPDNLKGVVFQPMLCQHCDNAPCENVCPVAATNHSMEGINQMAYNRCIGTRYCANNCPFKVRRFNWADYTGADSFKNNQDQSLVGKLDDVVFQMNDDLTRMVLNPDVTVRSRGVMEKCTFCVQKLQSAKLDAKKAGTTLPDGKAQTACQTACATSAIVFGNIHDKTSVINKVREENDQRKFYVLEQLHVLPSVSYLAKVRNTEEVIEGKHHVAGEKHEEMPAATKPEETH